MEGLVLAAGVHTTPLGTKPVYRTAWLCNASESTTCSYVMVAIPAPLSPLGMGTACAEAAPAADCIAQLPLTPFPCCTLALACGVSYMPVCMSAPPTCCFLML